MIKEKRKFDKIMLEKTKKKTNTEFILFQYRYPFDTFEILIAMNVLFFFVLSKFLVCDIQLFPHLVLYHILVHHQPMLYSNVILLSFDSFYWYISIDGILLMNMLEVQMVIHFVFD